MILTTEAANSLKRMNIRHHDTLSQRLDTKFNVFEHRYTESGIMSSGKFQRWNGWMARPASCIYTYHAVLC
jgi:hypothetical protein